MKILFTGDVHGLFEDFNKHLIRIHQFYRYDLVIQLGDFGFYPNLIDELEQTQSNFAFPVYAIDGNHENHHWLAKQNKNTLQKWRKELNLSFVNRGEVLCFDNLKIGALGGALNVDRPQQFNNSIANYVTRNNVEAALKAFNKKKVNLIVTHSCPATIGLGQKGNPQFAAGVNRFIQAAGHNSGPNDDCGEYELAELWKGLNIKPSHWIFGHFHTFFQSSIEGTSFWGLPEFHNPPLLFYDTNNAEIICLK